MESEHTSFRFEISPNSGGGTILADTVSLTTGALDDRLAAWTYDRAPGGKGMAATETSWQDGLAYTTTVAGYNKRYQPTSTKINIPGPFTTDPLAGDWKFTTTFNEAGQPVTVTKPLVPVNPSLPGNAPGSTDVTTTGYNGFGQADQLWEGNAAVPVAATPRYVTGTTFDPLGRVTERYLSRTTVTATPALNRSYGYNSATGALDEIKAGWTTTGGPATTLFQHDTYTRDAIGRVTRIDDNGLEGPTTDSNVDECFVYDNWNRLIRAHSVTGGGACVDDTVDATVASGSRDEYDTVWTFDDINRMRTTTDMLPGGATTTYGYAGNKHAVTGLTGPTTAGYTYYANGAMDNRDGDTLTYDAQQRLTKYSTTEEYVYTTTNQRLIRQAGGTRTLYLPGMEVSVTGTTRTINCYLTIGSTRVGTKTSTQPSGGSLSYSYAFACGNMQNTNVCQVNAGSGDIPTRKRYAPYGASRQDDPVTFPNTDRGFLNQPEDANGLVYLNNRYHDPTLGHFISVDPLVGKTGQPYLYGDGNPTTLSDPSGLCATFSSIMGSDGVWRGGSHDDGKGPCKLSAEQEAVLKRFTNGDRFLNEVVLWNDIQANERARKRASQSSLHERKAVALAPVYGLDNFDPNDASLSSATPTGFCSDNCSFWKGYLGATGAEGLDGYDPSMCAAGDCSHVSFMVGGIVDDNFVYGSGDSSLLTWKNRVDLAATVCSFKPACGPSSAVYAAGSWIVGNTVDAPEGTATYEVDITATLWRYDASTGTYKGTVLSTTPVVISSPLSEVVNTGQHAVVNAAFLNENLSP